VGALAVRANPQEREAKDDPAMVGGTEDPVATFTLVDPRSAAPGPLQMAMLSVAAVPDKGEPSTHCKGGRECQRQCWIPR
jgi:hypothetical protein